ncbi:MAG TPA: DEAD/DEAH box helicase family protein, partial [Ruminiclostridium sp.]
MAAQQCSEILKHDCGILYASTAFGKTVAALDIIAKRRVSTLIIVNSIELLEQWETKVDVFLDLSGRKTGKLGGGKKKPSRFIDIATIQTLYKAENLNEILDSYGQVVIKVRYTDLNKGNRGNKLAHAFIPKRVILKTENYKEDKFKISDYYQLIQNDDNRNNLI